MVETGAVIALVVGVMVIFLVPALVWSAVIAGLYQMVRNKVQRGFRALRYKTKTVAHTR